MSTPQNAPRVALVVDHPSRDLPGTVLTAVELCRRGAVCHLVPANLAWREVWALAPDLVLLNYFRRSNESLGRGLAAAGIPFGLLDTEGGVWPDPGKYAELLWEDRDLLHLAQRVCLWGTRMAEYLVEQGYFTPSQVVVTGCPRFDLYAPAWQRVLAPAEPSKAPPRPRVLVNTNFSTRNPRFTTVEKKIETSRTNFGWSDDRISELLRVEEEAIGGLIRLCATLAERFPGAEIRVRPHPFEDPAWYQRELAGWTNVAVDGDGPVQPAIYEADVVVQRSCTTAIESGLAGTPTLSPQWVPAPLLMPVAEAVSVPCQSPEELGDVVESILERRYHATPALRESINTVTREWFCAADGASYRRVADAILPATVAAGRGKDLRRADEYLFLYDLQGRRHQGLAAAGAHLRRALRRSPDWSFRLGAPAPATWWTQTAKSFTVEDVQLLATRVGEAMEPRNRDARRLRASTARSRGDFRHGYDGFSVTLAWDEDAS